MLRTKVEETLHDVAKTAAGLGLLVETDLNSTSFCSGTNADGHRLPGSLYYIHHISRVDVFCDSPADADAFAQLMRSTVGSELGIWRMYHSSANGTLEGVHFSL